MMAINGKNNFFILLVFFVLLFDEFECCIADGKDINAVCQRRDVEAVAVPLFLLHDDAAAG